MMNIDMTPNHLIGDRFLIKDPLADLIGQGGMGTVYRGVDVQMKTVVAIKVLHPILVTDQPDLIARFVREGEMLRQLNHPNIVKFITAVQQDERYYLVMEYVTGGSLETLLGAGAIAARAGDHHWLGVGGCADTRPPFGHYSP